MRLTKRMLFFIVTPLLVMTSYLGLSGKGRAELGLSTKGSTEEDDSRGNLWIKSGYHDFIKGNFEDTTVSKSGNDGITLKQLDGSFKPQGVYTSQIIHTAPFEYMILSWDANTPAGTSVKIEAQVEVNKAGSKQWSQWLSWGTWSAASERASANPEDAEDALAKLSTDTLTVKGKEGETAGAVRFRLTLSTTNKAVTPSVRLVAGTLRNTLPGQSIPSIYPEDEKLPDLSKLNKDIDVPSYSQYLRHPEIAHYICSPTSVTSILNYHGVELLPEEAAWGVYDKVYEGFGNWSFSTAYAGSYGFTSYVKYCESVNDLKREIYLGYPAAVSVKYKNSENVNANLPVIHGAPISKTQGHLIVVRGFTWENGKEYVIVNDSAAPSDEGAKLKYLVEEFDRAWQTSGRTAYIIHKGEGQKNAPVREAASLREAKAASSPNKSYREFELYSGNEIIDLSSENAKTIMFSRNGERYEYMTPGEGKNLVFDKSMKNGRYDFLIIARDNKIYKAEIQWDGVTSGQ